MGARDVLFWRRTAISDVPKYSFWWGLYVPEEDGVSGFLDSGLIASSKRVRRKPIITSIVSWLIDAGKNVSGSGPVY
jgi:hypothetical protein